MADYKMEAAKAAIKLIKPGQNIGLGGGTTVANLVGLLALENSHLAHNPLPRPRWQRRRPQRPHSRITTPQAISLLRADLWASALGLQNKSGFAAPDSCAAKPLLIENHLQSAVLYASG